MTKRLFSISVWSSLAIGLAIVSAWVFSYATTTGFRWIPASEDRMFNVGWMTGTFIMAYSRFEPQEGEGVKSGFSVASLPISAATEEAHRIWWRAAGGPKFAFAGFRLGSVVSSGSSDYVFDIPLWGLALLAACLPMIAVYRCARARRRKRLRLCVACGYDLRESEDRCPECGRIVAPNVSSAT
jgi:hypothetical protein